MKTHHRWFVCLTACLLAVLCLPDVVGATEERPWFVGLKTGIVSLDESGVDDLTQAGVLLGYKFARGDWGSVAIEGEYADTVSEGDLDFPGAEWSAESLAGCLAYRSAGRGYFKGKVGYTDVTAEVSAFGLSEEVDDSDFSAGIGFGWKFRKNTALEIEWTRSFFDEDVDFFSIGINF